MRHVEAKGGIEERAREVRAGPDSRRAELHLCLVLLRVGSKLRDVAHWQIASRNQNLREIYGKSDGRKVGRSIVKGIFEDRLVLGMGAGAAEHELIAIGCCLGHAGTTNHAT